MTRPPKSSGEVAEGRVQRLVLGQEGLTVATGRNELTVASGVVGERVRVRVKPGHTFVERVLDPSPDRCLAPCAVLHRCGACSLQEMTYTRQVATKTEALRCAMSDELGCDATRVQDVAGMHHPFGYRTKLLAAAGGEAGALRFGFYRRGTLRLIPAEGCPVQHPLTLGVLAMVRQVLDAHRIAPSQQRGKRKGWLHAVGIRTDPVTGVSELTLSGTNDRVSPRLVTQLSQIVGSLSLTVNPERSSYPLAQQHQLLAGPRRTVFHIGGRRFAVSAGTFVQSSAEGADLLAREVLELLPEKIHCFADLYGGVGVFSLLAAERWNRAVVIEENRGAIGDLKQMLRREPKLKERVISRAGRVEKLLAELPRRQPDCVLLDPPRRGCKPAVIEALADLRPETIVYVACGFDALLRDGALLRRAGYLVDAVRGVDMFPHTPHLEVVARFRSTGRSGPRTRPARKKRSGKSA